jgi:hypothetical protein
MTCSFIVRSRESPPPPIKIIHLTERSDTLALSIRNYGGDKEELKERRGGAKEQQRQPSQVGVPIQVELKSNLDSRNSPHQNRRPDHIPALFWTFFIWMER